MRRLLVRSGAWFAATAAAVTLSWLGVHAALRGTLYDTPQAVSVSDASSWPPSAEPDASSTIRPGPGPSPGPGPDPQDPQDQQDQQEPSAPSRAPDRAEADEPPPATASAPAEVETVATDGGRVVIELRAQDAELVSATPEPGWEMQVWNEDYWLRVTFTLEGREVSVFCTWYGHPPLVERHEDPGGG